MNEIPEMSTSPPLVSVVMAVFNGSAYLGQAIESVLRQTCASFELLVVDDCSTDDSTGIVARYLADPRVRLIRRTENGGVARARNQALEVAQGNFIAFLDQDDYWFPHKLEIQLAALNAHPEVGLMHAGYSRIDPAGHLLEAWQALPPERFDNPHATVSVGDVFAEIFISNDIQPLTTVIPRHVIDTVGAFDPELPGVDDYELWLRIALRYPVGRVDTILGHWRAHPGQQSNRGYRMLMIRLEALERFITRFPDAKKRVPAAAFRTRMHNHYRGAANYTLYYLHDYPAAHRLFVRGLTYRRLDLVSRGKAVYCKLPEGARNLLKSTARLFKSKSRRHP